MCAYLTHLWPRLSGRWGPEGGAGVRRQPDPLTPSWGSASRRAAGQLTCSVLGSCQAGSFLRPFSAGRITRRAMSREMSREVSRPPLASAGSAGADLQLVVWPAQTLSW